MSVTLVSIPHVKPEWEIAHRIRALSVDGNSPALVALDDLWERHREDYAKLLETIRLVVGNRRLQNPNRVRKDERGEDIYEMKGGHSRLFFFYASNDEIVVCTHHYWKAKPSKKEQDIEFRRCSRLRELYLREGGGPSVGAAPNWKKR